MHSTLTFSGKPREHLLKPVGSSKSTKTTNFPNPILGNRDYATLGTRAYPIMGACDYPILGILDYPILGTRDYPILGIRDFPILGIVTENVISYW